MSVFDEQLKGLSPEEQSILVEVSQALYSAAEAQLLEGLRHTQDRPRDGFDALVMVCSVARAIQSLSIGRECLIEVHLLILFAVRRETHDIIIGE